jgi:hypothetical protein
VPFATLVTLELPTIQWIHPSLSDYQHYCDDTLGLLSNFISRPPRDTWLSALLTFHGQTSSSHTMQYQGNCYIYVRHERGPSPVNPCALITSPTRQFFRLNPRNIHVQCPIPVFVTMQLSHASEKHIGLCCYGTTPPWLKLSVLLLPQQ